MLCLIIAAGRGSRLAERTDCKPLVEISGTPLIERIISSVTQTGVRDFLVILGYNADKIKKQLDSFKKKENITINYLTNRGWRRQNGVSVHCASKKLNKPFLLLMSDHLFDPEIIKDLLKIQIEDDEIILAVDKRIKNNPLIDLLDVTKVEVKKDKILKIGKNISPFNAFDTGIFFCSPAIFEGLEESFSTGDESLSGGISVLAKKDKARIYNIGNRFWLDVDDEAAFSKAGKYFLKIR